MNKLLWVALPLVVIALWWLVLALRGRLPSRLALNVMTSVLLLIYLCITAGLGIFWVANQHLPVFDWHYLFGYLTIVLVMVHLGFNARIVWRWWVQRLRQNASVTSTPAVTRQPSGSVELPAQPARRGMMGLGIVLGLLSTGGVGYLLGLRHGKTQLIVQPVSSTGAGASAAQQAQGLAQAVVAQFHEFSAHSRAGLFRRAPSMHWGGQPPAFKAVAASAQRVALPAPVSQPTSTRSALEALGDVLWHTAGVNLESMGVAFRTSPSSGALFASEFYVLPLQIAGLSSQWWRYDARDHALISIRADSDLQLEQQTLQQYVDAPWASAQTPLTWIVATAVFARSGHKYRDRTYRYVLADLGHALENINLSAYARGWHMHWAAAFDEQAIAMRLDVDETQEGVLAVGTLGQPHTTTYTHSSAPRFKPAILELQAIGPLGVTDAIHRACSLSLSNLSDQPAVTAVAQPSLSSASSLANRPSHALASNSCGLIAKRRSVRRYSRSAMPQAWIEQLLQATVYPGAASLSTAVRTHVLVHAVDGLEMAAWHWSSTQDRNKSVSGWRRAANINGDALSPLTRAASKQAGLDQEVIGDAAAVVILSIDRAELMRDLLGYARAYRHAFMQAGLQGERLYLEATARGVACCGVGAFYDDDAAQLLGLKLDNHWIVHFVALGMPD